MKKLFAYLLFFYCVCSFAVTASAQQSVEQASQAWANVLASRDPQKITQLYADDAYLFATFQDMLDNRAAIQAYFAKLAKHEGLNVTFIQQNIRLYGETAINSGLYTFSYQENGKLVKIPARYTFVYTKTPNGWLIVEHHSSVLPE